MAAWGLEVLMISSILIEGRWKVCAIVL